MDTNKMREQFESAYVEEMALCCGQDIRQRAKANLEWRQENGDYRDPMVRLAYWAWKASRESVVVELPPHEDFRCDTSWEEARQEAYNRALDESRTAIEVHGLKVSP